MNKAELHFLLSRIVLVLCWVCWCSYPIPRAIAEDNTVTIYNGVVTNYPSGGLVVGGVGTNNWLIVTNGARVISGNGTVGLEGDYNGAIITGPGSTWSNVYWFKVGLAGGGNVVVVTNGGHLENGMLAVIGDNNNVADNAVWVTGSGSVWRNASSLTVGWGGTRCSLVISNGGRVFDTDASVGHGYSFANSNTVIVTGLGSLWQNSGGLTLGNLGSGQRVAIADLGAVVASGLTVGSSGNLIEINEGSLIITNATRTSRVNLAGGSVNLNSGVIQANELRLYNPQSELRLTNGVVTLATSNGTAVIDTRGAGLVLTGGAQTAGGGFTWGANARLAGCGSLSGAITNAGTVSRSGRSGILVFNHSLRLDPPSLMSFSLEEANAGVAQSFIQVNGPVTFDGRLSVQLTNDFQPSPRMTFNLIQYSSRSGGFTNLSPGGRLISAGRSGSFRVIDTGSHLLLDDFQAGDLDGDGIEDAWAQLYFGQSPLAEGTDPNDKHGDKDGDGLSNEAEYRAGTNPVLATSVFKLEPVRRDGVWGLEFPGQPSRFYRLWHSSDLQTWTELLAPVLEFPEPGIGRWIVDPIPGSAPASVLHGYRLSVE